jgi:CDP-diacylglycerol--serine O-phosphatidyltransferase
MGVRDFSRQITDPNSAHLKRRKAAYALPTLFTAGSVFLGFFSIMNSFQAAIHSRPGSTGPNTFFEVAAIAIVWAMVLDGLDGRIARITNTASDFGRELDSLADVIAFGIAPAVLAFAWGVQPAIGSASQPLRDYLHRVGIFIPFLYLICGAARLARFNIQKNPVPKNPGRSDRKYFVGLPIPAAAAMVAAVVYASGGRPLQYWPLTVAWLGLLALLSFLMVCTWRYRSFKDMQLQRPRSWLSAIAFGVLIYFIWAATGIALPAIFGLYVASGIVVRVAGALRRRFKRARPAPEQQLG